MDDAAQAPRWRVFVSHSGENLWVARQIARDSLEAEIGEALRSSDMVVSVVGSDGFSSPWLYFELGAALAMGKKMVAIVPNDLDPASLPRFIRARKYLPKESPEAVADQLASSVERSGNAA